MDNCKLAPARNKSKPFISRKTRMRPAGANEMGARAGVAPARNKSKPFICSGLAGANRLGRRAGEAPAWLLAGATLAPTRASYAGVGTRAGEAPAWLLAGATLAPTRASYAGVGTSWEAGLLIVDQVGAGSGCQVETGFRGDPARYFLASVFKNM